MKPLALLFLLLVLPYNLTAIDDTLPIEKVDGEGQWVDPMVRRRLQTGAGTTGVTIWYDKQFLGTGTSYLSRAKEFKAARRTLLRKKVIKTLKRLSRSTHLENKSTLDELIKAKQLRNLNTHWIVNGFSADINAEGLKKLETMPSVKKIFLTRKSAMRSKPRTQPVFKPFVEDKPFKIDNFPRPWYARALMARRLWVEHGITGQGTLNVIHDFNFIFIPSINKRIYVNKDEIPGNGIDDDNNGWVDDVNGYNFFSKSPHMTTTPLTAKDQTNPDPRKFHGTMCAAIVCGTGAGPGKPALGLAPGGRWAGVIGPIEEAVEWSLEQGADTFSMSFSLPNLGDYRSHWRKVMEHASFAGLYFASGAGNFADKNSRAYAPIPVQMRIPEDIPHAVFAAAGVGRDFVRPIFSSQGPVKWMTEHYKDGLVNKPTVAAFNNNLPMLLPDGTSPPHMQWLQGNSFAGPMFCATLSLMLSADPDILPWDMQEVLIATASDFGKQGWDAQSGHGLINCYRAGREVLRRKAIREGKDPTPFTGDVALDRLDIEAHVKRMNNKKVMIQQVSDGQCKDAGILAGDIVKSYAGTPIYKKTDLKPAKTAASERGDSKVSFVVIRKGKELTFTLTPGTLGVILADSFPDPAFE